MNIDENIDSIINNLINGNRNDALNQFRDMNPLHAAYAAVLVMENESVTAENKRWLMNALYNGK